MKTPFRILLLDRAKHYADAHVHEQGGNNRGPEVEHFQRVNHGHPGDAWCADFVSCCGLEVHDPMLHDLAGARTWLQANFFKPSGTCVEIMDDAKHRGTWRDKSWKPTAGSLVIYKFPTGHHIEVVRDLMGSALRTVGGNTSDDDPRDGDNVAYKERNLKFVLGYVDLGNS